MYSPARINNSAKHLEPADLVSIAPMGTLSGPPESIHRPVWSHDGRWLAAACRTRAIAIWDMAELSLGESSFFGTRVRLIEVGDQVGSAVTSVRQPAPGFVFTSGDRIHYVAIDGDSPITLLGEHPGAVVALASNGRYVASLGSGTLKIWDPAAAPTAQEMVTLPLGVSEAFDLAWTAGGNWIAVATAAGLTLIDPRAAEQPVHLEVEDVIDSVAWSADGTRLAGGSHGGDIYLWQRGETRPQQRIRGHLAAVTSVSFSCNGLLLASMSANRDVQVWTVGDGHKRHEIPEQIAEPDDALKPGINFNPAASVLATADSYDQLTICLWSVRMNVPGRRLRPVATSGPSSAPAVEPVVDIDHSAGPLAELAERAQATGVYSRTSGAPPPHRGWRFVTAIPIADVAVAGAEESGGSAVPPPRRPPWLPPRDAAQAARAQQHDHAPQALSARLGRQARSALRAQPATQSQTMPRAHRVMPHAQQTGSHQALQPRQTLPAVQVQRALQAQQALQARQALQTRQALQNRSAVAKIMRGPLVVDAAALMTHVVETTGLILPERSYRHIASALNAGKHVMFTGAPGTGKTTLARAVASFAAASGWTAAPLCTAASAAWRTSETIGYRSPDGGFRPGLLLRAMSAARWLVIDEIEHADADIAFGTILPVLSGHGVELPHDVGGTPIQVRPHSGDISDFADAARGDLGACVVHPNWRILATRSTGSHARRLARLPALMRHFAVIDLVSPSADTYPILVERWLGQSDLPAPLMRSLTGTLVDFLSPDTPLMRRCPLSPAVVRCMSAHMRERARTGDGDATELLAEAFVLYAAHQLEQLHTSDIAAVERYLYTVFADPESARVVSARFRTFHRAPVAAGRSDA